MSHSYVYVLSNVSMPGLLKIGRTDRSPVDRAKELATTGVPTPFILEHFVHIENSVDAEATIHRILEEKGYRTSRTREFFELSVAEARAVIELALNLTTTDEPDFSLRLILKEELSRIQLPWTRGTTKEEAWSQGERLADIARRGLPEAMKRGAEIFDMSCKWESQFRKFSQEYFELRRKETLTEALYSAGRQTRNELGKDVAAYLETLCRNSWLNDDDFEFVTIFLVSGDQFIYEGYIDQVRRPDFSDSIRERALNI